MGEVGLVELEFGLESEEIGFGRLFGRGFGGGFDDGEEMDVSVRNVDADDFELDALA